MSDVIKNKIITKNTGIVFASEVGSGLGAIVTAPLVDKVVHNADIKRLTAKLILPHLEQIEKATGLTRGVHAYHDALHEGKDKPYSELPPRQRAERLADVILNGSAAFIAENGISFGIQVLLKRLTKSDISPVKTGLIGASVHLGFIGLSTTIASKPTEWLSHKLSSMLPKMTGMDQDKADKLARNFTYVIAPGLAAFLAESFVANSSHKK